MPFVLEQNPSMINIILDFLENNSDKILREEYFWSTYKYWYKTFMWKNKI